MRKSNLAVVLLLMFCLAVTIAHSGEVKEYRNDEARFSFEYPDGWRAFSREEAIRATEGRLQINEKTVAIVANPKDWDQNLNVQVIQVPEADFGDEFWTEFIAGCDANLSSALPEFKKISAMITQIAGCEGVEYVYEFNRLGQRMQQKQVSFLYDGRFCIMTFTAKKEDFAEVDRGCFSKIIESLKVW